MIAKTWHPDRTISLQDHELAVWLDDGVLIRDAHPDEYSEIGDIRVGAYLADGFLSPDSGYAPRLRELGTDGLDPVLVAVDDHGTLIGTVMLQVWPQGGGVVKGPDEAEIRALAVRPEARGAGVGRALLAAVIDRAARLDVQHLVLLTQPEMKAAHHLYDTAGFSRLPERDWSPEPDVRLLAYSMRLAPAGEPRGASCTPASRLGLAESPRWGAVGKQRSSGC
jgi:ribosomal protein S18 acetylase RimI-like enzyme